MTTHPSSESDLVVPDWFWEVLESAKPELQRLVDWLEAASREEIVEFQRTYEDAAQAICDYWDGPVVGDIVFSEDDTEDFCTWVVSQGRALWEQALVAADLEPLVQLYRASESESDTTWPNWNPKVLNPAYPKPAQYSIHNRPAAFVVGGLAGGEAGSAEFRVAVAGGNW
ncbi:MAG: DUF4240 domain-containing protein [Blastocatellia bacterium]|nr:DUF4240 domain-containing protein [Blastocatellia bacterium]